MPDGLRPNAPLTEQQRHEALERFHLLQPCLEEGVPLVEVARTQVIPYRTAKRWLHQYRQRGLAGLVRQSRADRGRPRLPEPLARLIEGLALRRPQPSVASIQRQVATVAPAQGWPVPSYDCVYDIVRRLDPGLVTLAHEGAKAYKEAFDLLYRHEASAPNDIWQADHTPLDLCVLDDAARPYARYPGGHDEGFADSHTAINRAIYDYIRAGDRASGRAPDFPTFVDGHRENVIGDCILRSAREELWAEVPN